MKSCHTALAGLLLCLSLVLASCATPQSDSGTPQPDRREQYLPPAQSLKHRQYVIVDQPGQRNIMRRWGGRVPAVIGDEVWNWEFESEGKVYQGEALVRNGRPVDGYILRTLPGTSAGAAPSSAAPETAGAPATVPSE